MKVLLFDMSGDNLDETFREAAENYQADFNPSDWDNVNHQLNQMEKSERISRSAMADKFIEIANEFTKVEPKERVGAAIMFAAARYNAFEASSKSNNLLKDKDDALSWYSAEYRRMLEANIDDLVKML